jgi:membrane protease YdiL (CAAX protease family)
MSDLSMAGNLAAGLLLTASAAVWITVVARWQRGTAVVELLPREACRWHPAAVALALPASIFVQQVVSERFPPEPSLLDFVQGRCLAMTLEMCLLLGLLAIWAPIRACDFGIDASRLAGDFRVGGLGFLASLLPVYAVNYAVEMLGLRTEGARHSLLKFIESVGTAEAAFWSILSAVVLAPLAEELLYRVILQGWLQARLTPRAAILFVAAIFAFVHVEEGRPDFLPLFPLALILGYVYYRRHSYVAVVILHALFNAMTLAFTLLRLG